MIIESGEGKGLGYDYPLSVTSGYDKDKSFNVAFNSGNATAPVLARTATSGKTDYITDLTFSASAATWVQLQDNDGTAITPRIYLAANGNWDHTFMTPKKVTQSKAIMVVSGLAVPVSVSIDGYQR